MFSLRILSVELPDAGEVGTSSSAAGGATASNPSNPLPSTTSATTPLELPGVTSSASSARNPRISHTRGVLHLYRSVYFSFPPASPYASSVAATPSAPPLPCDSQLPSSRGTRLLVLAVPTRVSRDVFVRSCIPYHASDIRVISDSGVKDRYSVLLEFEDQRCADRYYLDINGRRFTSSEEEVCHLLFIVSVQYTLCPEIAVIPPARSTELPTCPVCIERLDQDISGIVATNCDHSFQCSCVSMWHPSSCLVCQFCQKQSETPKIHTICSVCQTFEDLWICVICGFVGCGRYKAGHSIRHWRETQHSYSLDLKTQRVWDYVSESYVHRLDQSKSDANHAMPEPKSEYSEDNCVSCSCNENMGTVMFGTKTEMIVDEYNRLLAYQLKTQREYYDALVLDAKKKREEHISAAVNKAIDDKHQEMHLKLANTMSEKQKVAEMNEKLTKTQDKLCETVKAIEERERHQLGQKDAMIHDLGQQIEDFKYSLKLKEKIGKSTDMKEGTLVPLAMDSDSVKGSRSSKRKGRNRR